jgi:uncharacterized membrane protein
MIPFRYSLGYSIIDVLWAIVFVAIIAAVLKFFGSQYNLGRIFAGIIIGLMILMLLGSYFRRIVRFISRKKRNAEHPNA